MAKKKVEEKNELDTELFEIDPEILNEFINETEETFIELDNFFIELENDPRNLEIINNIFRPIHSIKGNSSFFGLVKTKKLAHEMETLLDLMRTEKIIVNNNIISLLLEGVDMLKNIISRVKQEKPEIEDENIYKNILAKTIETHEKKQIKPLKILRELDIKLKNLMVDLVLEENSKAQELDAILQMVSSLFNEEKKETDTENKVETSNKNINEKETNNIIKKETNKTQPTSKTLRISEKSIDDFLSYVGELIVVEEMFVYLEQHMSEQLENTAAINELKKIIEIFSNLSDNLQKSIMKIRKLPIKNIFQKLTRQARDIAAQQNKKIIITMSGENIMVDKSILENLEAPLSHMIRNAVDHGIETPEQRISNNKNEQGTITIQALENDENIIIKIIDDGAGIKLENVKSKAVSKGLLSPEQNLSKQEIINLLFLPGMSTAEKVTEISGRGVGMDVVKTNIENANGKIIIDSEEEIGSYFTIELPKSVITQIIEGFVFSLNKKFYVVPIDKVMEVFYVEPKQIETVINKGETVLRHGEVLTVIRLSSIFNYNKSQTEQNNQGVMIKIKSKNKKLVIYVDEVLGIQQVVLKNIENMKKETSKIFKGACLMGEGSVGMVLDIDNLLSEKV